ncbi:MAG: hypothetical protein KGK34_07815 [Chloroflexota bacterium]|nr:hypothetical protein [Chloroflexota bacterium]
MTDRGLRALGTALALVAAAVHLALFTSDLVPGETTTVPAFAAMGLGLAGCAVVLALGRRDLYEPVPIYAGVLVLAWAWTRTQYPVEVFGIVADSAELALIAVTIVLIRRADARRTVGRGRGKAA